MKAPSTPLLTDEDVAQILGMSKDEVRRSCRAELFPHAKFGRKYRFTDADVEAIVAAHHRDAKVTDANPWGIRGRGRTAS